MNLSYRVIKNGKMPFSSEKIEISSGEKREKSSIEKNRITPGSKEETVKKSLSV